MSYVPSQGEVKSSNDIEQNIEASISSTIRAGFIRKVYGILAFQLIFTTVITGLACMSKEVQIFMANHVILLFLSLVASFAVSLVVCCCPSLTRQFPQNYILLGIFTIGEGYLVAAICSTTSPGIVLMAAVMTTVMVVGLTIYSMVTKTDFTTKGGYLCVFILGLMLLSVFGLFTNNNFFHILICSGTIILYGFYLIYDTQLIIGKNQDIIQTDDYILGALMLYIDIIQIFLNLLELFNRLRADN